MKNKNNNHYTLEELRAMGLVSNTDGRPRKGLTNEKWQREIEIRKTFISPAPVGKKRMGGKFSKESGTWNEETQGIYSGMTNYQQYVSYINSVLKEIESGHIDYCYFIYQITDLLTFHYNTLRTRYVEDGEYWEVWLDK